MNAPSTVIGKTVRLLGGQTAVAQICAAVTGMPVKQAHVWNWINRDLRVPPEFAVVLELEARKAGGNTRREDLCPDFPWGLLVAAPSAASEEAA